VKAFSPYEQCIRLQKGENALTLTRKEGSFKAVVKAAHDHPSME
jgi:hypothetical protein